MTATWLAQMLAGLMTVAQSTVTDSVILPVFLSVVGLGLATIIGMLGWFIRKQSERVDQVKEDVTGLETFVCGYKGQGGLYNEFKDLKREAESMRTEIGVLRAELTRLLTMGDHPVSAGAYRLQTPPGGRAIGEPHV